MTVSYYRSDTPRDWHEHDVAHVSIILVGDLQEHSGCEIAEASTGALRIRPEGFRHAVTFGGHGALILTLPASSAEERLELQRAWQRLTKPNAAREVLRNLITAVACDAGTASTELIAIASPWPQSAPKWLRSARECIIEEPATARVDMLAAQAGVHRVHFARTFIAQFGEPPSVMRRRAMIEHALSAIFDKRTSLANAAAEAGFSDQAHMTRAFVEFLGMPPARLRSLLR